MQSHYNRKCMKIYQEKYLREDHIRKKKNKKKQK